MPGFCTTCNGWRAPVSCIWRKMEQAPEHGVVCQRSGRFASVRRWRRGRASDVVGQFNQAFREAAEGLYGPTFQQSVNHNRARLSEEQAPNLVVDYWPL